MQVVQLMQHHSHVCHVPPEPISGIDVEPDVVVDHGLLGGVAQLGEYVLTQPMHVGGGTVDDQLDQLGRLVDPQVNPGLGPMNNKKYRRIN